MSSVNDSKSFEIQFFVTRNLEFSTVKRKFKFWLLLTVWNYPIFEIVTILVEYYRRLQRSTKRETTFSSRSIGYITNTYN